MADLQTTYTAAEFAALIPEVDEATATNLYSYFGDRVPMSNFAHFIHQKMLLYADQYARMQRDESVKYDAMVTDYLEAKYTDKAEKSGTTKSTTTGKDITDGTVKTDNSGTSNNDNKHLEKTNPMQNTYTADAGTFPALSWDTSDTQTQDISDNTTTGSETVKTDNNVSHETTTEGTTGGTDTSTHTERRTGRAGRSPAELLKVSMDYIVATKSFAWLIDRLNPCFIWSIDL